MGGASSSTKNTEWRPNNDLADTGEASSSTPKREGQPNNDLTDMGGASSTVNMECLPNKDLTGIGGASSSTVKREWKPNNNDLTDMGGASSSTTKRDWQPNHGLTDMGGASSTVNMECQPKNDLTAIELHDIVLSWSIHDIFNDNLYKDQVQKIPDAFHSRDHYLSSYAFPLLEETRATVASSMEAIDKAPFAEVASFELVNGPGKVIHYKVKVDFWKTRVSDEGEEYRTMPGDLVIISNTKLEWVSDLNRVGLDWILASVVDVTDDDGYLSTNFKVKMAKDFDTRIGRHTAVHIVFLVNFKSNKMIWNAFRMNLTSTKSESIQQTKNINILDAILNKKYESDKKCYTCCPHGGNGSASTEKIKDGFLSRLNESQANAVATCLERVNCDHMSHVGLIWGPPGTGKTTTISVLLFLLLKKRCRTLLCAPTNVAITQVASRVIKLIKKSYIDESSKQNLFPLGDVLLFGDNPRMKVGEDTEEMYLNNRIDRLLECFEPLTGWRHCIESAICFLQGSLPEYERMDSAKPVSFAAFKSQFEQVVSHLRRCMSIMCTHMPTQFIQEHNFQSITSLMRHLDALAETLFVKSVMSEELKEIFYEQENSEVLSESFVDRSSLFCLKNQCLSLLKTLLHSLRQLHLPSSLSRTEMAEFCLELPSLVFCTSSSSFKMDRVKMRPFNLLVIDEASQLRECESILLLQLPGLKHAILVGDERQLPAIVHSKVSDEAGFGKSLFERLSSLGHSKLMLDVQYRMHPAISCFPNFSFYNKQIKDASNVRSTSYERQYLCEI